MLYGTSRGRGRERGAAHDLRNGHAPLPGRHPPALSEVERGGSSVVARGAGGHWPPGLGRAAEVRWLSGRRRVGIVGRWSPRQWRLFGRFRGDHERQPLAALGPGGHRRNPTPRGRPHAEERTFTRGCLRSSPGSIGSTMRTQLRPARRRPRGARCTERKMAHRSGPFVPSQSSSSAMAHPALLAGTSVLLGSQCRVTGTIVT